MNVLLTLKRAPSEALASRITAWALLSPRNIGSLVEVFFGSDYRMTQRAALPLIGAIRQRPGLFAPHWKRAVRSLERDDTPVAVRRNVLRLLQFTDVPPPWQGRVAASCFRLLQSRREPVAVKVFSMTVILHLLPAHPGLAAELRESIAAQSAYATPGFSARARTVLTALNSYSLR